MSTFIPDKGTLFYVECQFEHSMVTGSVFTEMRITKVKDRSYLGEVFLCLGSDQHAVVGRRPDMPEKSYGGAKVVFRQADYRFIPVGPDVAEAMGLAAPAEAS